MSNWEDELLLFASREIERDGLAKKGINVKDGGRHMVIAVLAQRIEAEKRKAVEEFGKKIMDNLVSVYEGRQTNTAEIAVVNRTTDLITQFLDTDLTPENLEEALEENVKLGYMERVVDEEGHVKYQITPEGRVHLESLMGQPKE